MDDFNEKLNSVLSNLQLMQQIMSMAQSMNSAQPAPEKQEPKDSGAQSQGLDPAMISKMVSLARDSGIDSNQRALVRALGPHVSKAKIEKLERAMRAAKLAEKASVFLSQTKL